MPSLLKIAARGQPAKRRPGDPSRRLARALAVQRATPLDRAMPFARLQRRAAVAARTLVLLAIALVAGCGGEPRGPCTQAQPLGSVCGFANPEDVAYAPTAELLVVSEFRIFGRGGALAGLTPGGSSPFRLWPPLTGAPTTERDPELGDAACPPPNPAAFHPHGIFVDGSSRLWVVNHGGRDSIEVFAIAGRGERTTLAWRGCVLLPEGTSGNDVAVADDGTVVVSNYAPSVDSLLANVKIGFGMTTGDVLRWRRGEGWSTVPGTAASAANGVALSPDGRTLYYAETGGARLVRIGLDGSGRAEVAVPGAPDNLSWTRQGTLYLASHTSSAAFLGCLFGAVCRSPWVLLEIEPDSLRVNEVLRHDGEVVGAIASAQQVGDLVYLGAVFGDRIGVWRATEDATGSIRPSLAGPAPDRVLAGNAFAASRASEPSSPGAASTTRGAEQS